MSANVTQNLFSQADLAAFLGVTEWAIWAMRRRGELPPAVRVGRALRWRPSVIDQWMLERERPANEFDPVFSERAEKAVRARGLQKKEFVGGDVKRGRPTKTEQVEGRR